MSLRLVPAGCQQWYPHKVAAVSSRFAFTSTLALYVFDAESCMLHRLIAGNTRTISALAWCPHDNSIVVTGSVDSSLRLWNVDTEDRLENVTIDSVPISIDWSPHNPDLLVIAVNNDSASGIRVFSRSSRSTKELASWKGTVKPTVVRCNKRVPDVFVVGAEDGSIFLGRGYSSRSCKRLPTEVKSEVVDMQWDPLSDDYLIVVFKNGAKELWDMGRLVRVNSYDRQGAGVKAVCWMEWAPGNFVTANQRNGVLSVWNVSQPQPLELMRIRRPGIAHFTTIPDSSKCVAAFVDGVVAVYDLVRRQTVWESNPGHRETIFDLRYDPLDKNALATGSYDQTIRVWDTRTMSCTISLGGRRGVVYGLDWSPVAPRRVVAVTSDGNFTVYDVETGRPLVEKALFSASSFRVAWNSGDPSRIVASSAAGDVVVVSPRGIVSASYPHPAAVYGVAWNPFEPSILATGCADGLVRIYDTTHPAATAPLATLRYHKKRVFNVAWSPLVQGRLASGSDDRTVCVWDVSTREPVVLSGHTSNVRALLWSTELPHILLSGSWDGTIRIWDVRVSSCVRVVRDHHGDVYGLHAHPGRPFVFASSSRDTTLRFWVLEEASDALRLRCMLGRPWSQLLGDVGDLSDAGSAPRLCGDGSRALRRACDATSSDVERLMLVTTFFSDAPGLETLWELVLAVRDRRPCSAACAMPHARDVLRIARARVSDLEAEKERGKGRVRAGATAVELTQQAAELRLQVGDLRAYCELMIKLDNWDRALAVAPAVSLPFWRDLCAKRAAALAEHESRDAAPFFAAAGQAAELVTFLVARGEHEAAFTVASAACAGRLKTAPVAGEAVGAAEGAPASAAAAAVAAAAGEGTAGESKVGDDAGAAPSDAALEQSAELRQIASTVARRAYERGEPVEAACAYLRVGDADQAVLMLRNGGESELAYAVGSALGVPDLDEVTAELAKHCVGRGLYDEAILLLGQTRRPREAVTLMCAQVGSAKSVAFTDMLYRKASMRDRTSYRSEADALLERHRESEALALLVLGQETAQAVKVGIKLTRAALNGSSWDIQSAKREFRPLYSLPLPALPPSVRAEVLAYAAFFGSQDAMWRGYAPIVPALCRAVRYLVRQHSVPLAVPIAQLTLQEAHFVSRTDIDEALRLLHEVTSAPSAPADLVGYAADMERTLETRLREGRELPPRPAGLVTAGSMLPTGTHVGGRQKSFITGRAILGPTVMLEDRASVISRAEAIMWARVNPFSPLHTGQVLNPF